MDINQALQNSTVLTKAMARESNEDLAAIVQILLTDSDVRDGILAALAEYGSALIAYLIDKAEPGELDPEHLNKEFLAKYFGSFDNWDTLRAAVLHHFTQRVMTDREVWGETVMQQISEDPIAFLQGQLIEEMTCLKLGSRYHVFIEWRFHSIHQD